MKKRSLVFALLILSLALNVSAKKKSSSSPDDGESSPSRNRRPTVAVARMRGENITMNENTAQSLIDIAIDSCVKNGLRCLERKDMDAIREEQALAASDEARPKQGRAKKGRMTTADVMVTCALTGSTTNAAGVGIAVHNKVLDTLGVKGVGVSTDRVTMTCRAYDTTTSEILLSKTTNKMAATTELVVFNYKSPLAKAVERSMDSFFKELKENL